MGLAFGYGLGAFSFLGRGALVKFVMGLLGVLFFSLFSFASGSRQAQLNELYAVYNQRFDSSGKYHADPRKAEEFIKAQEAFVAKMVSEGALQQILVVENNYDAKLWVRLFVLQDENQKILTVYWDQGKYTDREVESYLRFRNLQALAEGLKFVPVFDTHAINIKGYYLAAETGGSLQFVYALNAKNKQYAAKNAFLLKEQNRWVLKTEDKKIVTKARLDVWTQWLPPNGGVKSIEFQ